jgi:hypothetical protein
VTAASSPAPATTAAERLAALGATPDLSARVVYFPVRHHSPACAWHVDRLIRELKPDAVLIEGPRDASGIIPLLSHKGTRFPVAIYTTYVERSDGGPPQRHAAYYPMCDYSPELAAVRAGVAVKAKVRFIDLTFPEMIRAGRQRNERKAQSLLEERHLTHSRFLRRACDRAGARDPDDLWDHLFEVDHGQLKTPTFIRNVLGYCALARLDATEKALEADGTLARERAMAAAVAEAKGRVVVITGGFHTVALPQTKPAMPEAMSVAPADAVVVLMRYGFEQLDRLNGYASGMPSPNFYQWQWDGRSTDDLFVELGRTCRKRGQEISVADEIAGADHCRRLAQFRGHAMPSREDVLDGVRSAFVKGAADAEGLAVLAMARQMLAGERVGAVPPEAGQPPIVDDFRSTAERLGLDMDKVRATETHLDLYRRVAHREISRFFYRLRFLEVPFGELVRGPDFVAGQNLERIQEVWKYHWSPEVESALIERSVYGGSLDEASAAKLTEQFGENEQNGQGRRADLAAALVLEACRMGLHGSTPDLLARTGKLVSEDQSFPSLVRAIEALMVLHVSREPLEAHKLAGVSELASRAYDRACYLMPALGASGDADEPEVLSAMVELMQSIQTLGDTGERRALRWERLGELGRSPQGNAAVRGAALGLLYADGQLPADELVMRFRGHLLGSGGGDSENGSAFLRGLLRTARSAIWQVPQLVADLHETLTAMAEEQFVRQLPQLRLAFSDLTPRETDRVAKVVADHAGVAKLDVARSATLSSGDVALAVSIERRLAESLRRDGLLDWASETAEGES